MIHRNGSYLPTATERYLCIHHFADRSMRKFIRQTGVIGDCDYCDRSSIIVVELAELSQFIRTGLRSIYDYAVNWLPYDSREGGYQGATFETDELIEDHVLFAEYSDELISDLSWEVSDQLWCYDDPYGDNESERLLFDWNAFKHFVIHKARYTFFFLQRESYGSFAQSYKIDVAEILQDIARLLNRYKLIRTLKQNSVVYRCRQHDSEVIDKAEQVCSPPDNKAIYPNRMSPAGISMFYTAFNAATTIAETVDTSDAQQPYYTVATFITNTDLLIVDFTKLPSIPSIFNQNKKKDYFPLIFLRKFVEDLCKPVSRDGHEHTEYVPTQIITEYIRFMFSKEHNKQIEGIIFPSSKNRNDSSCVLFLDHQQSLEKLSLKELQKHKI